MADETKRTPSDQQAQGGEKPPAKPVTAADHHVAPGKAGDVAQGKDPAKVQPSPPGAAETSRPAGAPPATPAAPTHAAPPKPTGPAATPWEHARVGKLKQLYGSGIKDALTYLGQNYLVVNKEVA